MNKIKEPIVLLLLALTLTFFSFYLWGIDKTTDLLKIWGNVLVGIFLIHYGFEFYKKQKEFDRSTEIVKTLVTDYAKHELKAIVEKSPLIETMDILKVSLEEGNKKGYFFTLIDSTKNGWINSWKEMFDFSKAFQNMIIFHRSKRPECEELNLVLSYLHELSQSISMQGSGFLGELEAAKSVNDKLIKNWKKLGELYLTFKKTIFKLNDVLNRAHIKNYDLEKFKNELSKIDISQMGHHDL